MLLSVEDRARGLNAALGSRQMLLVIDDAWSVEDARRLEPPGRLQVDDRRSVLARQGGLPDEFPHSLAAVIGLSEQAPDPAARASLSDFPPKPESFSEPAAVAVASQPPKVLDQLVDAGLIEPDGPDRCAVHPRSACWPRRHSRLPHSRIHRRHQRALSLLRCLRPAGSD